MTTLQKCEKYLDNSRISDEIKTSDITDPKEAALVFNEFLMQEILGLKCGGIGDEFDYGYVTGIRHSLELFKYLFKNFKPEEELTTKVKVLH